MVASNMSTSAEAAAAAAAEHGTTHYDAVIARGKEVVSQHQKWRERSDKYPTDAQLDELAPIHDRARRSIKELEAAYDANPGSPRTQELSDLHWELVNLSAVSVDRERNVVRTLQKLEKERNRKE